MGLIGGAGLSRFIATQLYQVTATDPLIYGTVALVLATVALARLLTPRAPCEQHRSDGGAEIRMKKTINESSPTYFRCFAMNPGPVPARSRCRWRASNAP